MAVLFRCPLCGEEHRSRLRARDPATLVGLVEARGQILERCARRHEWVSVPQAQLCWSAQQARLRLR